MRHLRLVLAAVCLAFSVRAADYTWVVPGSGTGTFQNVSNWSPAPASVPGVEDHAKFLASGSYAVNFAGDATNRDATVGASGGADVTFNLNTYTWWLTNNFAYANTGAARFGGGTLEVGMPGQPRTSPTLTVPSNQKLVLDGGTARLRGPVSVSSGGTIEVNGGDHFLSWSMGLNAAPSGGASFRMTGGRLSMTTDDNYARCSLWSGSKISLEGGTLSIRYQVDMNGSPSSPGVIDIFTNATLAQCPGIGLNVSRTGGGLSIFNLLGGTYIQSNCNFNVVNATGTSLMTTGIVNVVDGKFFIHSSNLKHGSTSNGVAILRQTGGEIQVTGETGLGKEQNTLGVLRQEGGSAWYNQFYVGAFTGGRGEVDLSGGQLAIGNGGGAIGRIAGSAGRISQTGGDLIISNSFSVGNAAGAFGVYTNLGGNLWLKGTLYLGSSGSSLTGALGRAYFAGPSNYVESGITVGNSGVDTGELAIVDGMLNSPNNALTIANTALSCGSAWISGGTSTFKGVTVGSSGTGTLSLTGGTLTMTNGGALVVGSNLGSAGTLTISGGTLTQPSGGAIVGSSSGSRGVLEVSEGALMIPNGSLTVANGAGSSGVMTISGGLGICKDLTIGNAGTGTLAITGGTLTNNGALMVGNVLGSSGTLTISGGTNIFCGANTTFAQGGQALVRILGGYTYTTNRLVVGAGVSGTGRLELVGGVLSAPIIDGRDTTLATNPGGYSEVLFDGGTLHHSVDGEWWMPGGFVSLFGKATLTDRGAVIDSNGGVLTISQALSNETGYAGSFTKKGAGRLTLTSWFNAFTGRVAVEEGELAVSSGGGIYLTGGVDLHAGALLNLTAAGAVWDMTTAPGTVSRIDGALSLKPGAVLTNGVGAALSGSGVVTGSVVFASGSAWVQDKADHAGSLKVTGSVVLQPGVAFSLTGFTVADLKAGIPLVTATGSGSVQASGQIPVTLDGLSHPYWWIKVAEDGKTLAARYIPLGTLISLQ